MKELKADRTSTTATWEAADGSLVVRQYTEPHFYQPITDSGFMPISTKVTLDKEGGWLRANVNSVTAAFGPVGSAGGNEQIVTGGHTIGFAPRDTARGSHTPSGRASTVTYKDVWKNVDITDNVEVTGVKEDIVLKKPGTASTFAFDLFGATAQPSQDGGADLLVDGVRVGSVPAPTVATSQKLRPAAAAFDIATASFVPAADGAELKVVDGHLEISVSASWLAALPTSAFPVTIDPYIEYDDVTGAPEISYSNTGVMASTAQVGYDSSGRLWRAAAYFSTPVPPTPPAGYPPYQAISAYLGGFCVPSCSGVPGQHGLVDLNVRAESNPLNSTPTYASIPSGDLVTTGYGAGIAADLAVQWRGKTGLWIGFDGNTDGANASAGTWAQFPGDNLYMDFNMTENTPATTITSPANGSILAVTAPTLTAATAPDITGDGVHYRFQLTTSPDGTGSIIDSGWLTTRIWTVPPGALTDGVTYYASVQDTDWFLDYTPDEGAYLAPADPKPAISFQIKQRLGAGGPSATDTVGSAPSGTTTPSAGAPNPGTPSSSETVNMVTGNLALTVKTPQMQTVSGPAGVSLNYNALDSSVTAGHDYGLQGQYYLDPGYGHVFPAQPVGQRVDPGVYLFGQYGTPPIGGIPNTALGYMVKWTGSILLPSGSWHLGGETTGGMRIKVDGSSSWYYDDWSGSQPDDSAGYGGFTVTGGVRHTIEVDYWESYGGPSFETWAQLWAEDSSYTEDIVPVYWLRPDNTTLPPGWSLSPDAGTGEWTSTIDLGSQVILQSITGDTRTFTRNADGSGLYTSPAGDTDYLTRNGKGVLQLSTADDRLYVFNPDGTLASLTSTADDLHPTALQYAYSGSPTGLRGIRDPVSGRIIHLYYGGDSNCTAPTLGGEIAPTGQLCRILTWDGKSTVLGYSSNGQIQTVENTGSTGTFLEWDSNDLLSSIRDQLGVAYFRTNPTGWQPECQPTYSESDCAVDTAITYDSGGRVATITQPAPALGAPRPQRTYTYASGTTSVLIAGQGTGATYSTRVTYDSTSRLVTSTNWGQSPSVTVWDSEDRKIASVDPGGEQTSILYDDKGNLTDSYGPAPTHCFTGGWPAEASTAPPPAVGYLPAADPVGTAGCGVDVPHSYTGYDEGITGLAATYWANGQFAGAAALHRPASSSDAICEPHLDSLCLGWQDDDPVSSDASGHWSLRLNGTFHEDTSGMYQFVLVSAQPATLSIDGVQVANQTAVANPLTPGTYPGVPTTGLELSTGAHSIDIDYVGSSSAPDLVMLYDKPYSVEDGFDPVLNTVLSPDYGVATSSTDPDGKTTTTAYSDATVGPQYGLPTAVTADPGGLALTTSTTYETPGVDHYLRMTSTTLPGGTTTDIQYYGGTDGPIAAVCGVSSSALQGGQASARLDAAPAPGQPRRETQYVYDAAGRAVGTRVGPSISISDVGWSCTGYDDRGRITQQTWPAFGSAPARTVTYNYAVGGNPLVSSVTDSTSPTTVITRVDLLGRVVLYGDGPGKTTATTYDQAGRVLTTSGPGGTITDEYLVTGQLHAVSDDNGRVAIASYDPGSGRLSTVRYVNRITADVLYDSYGRQGEVDYLDRSDTVVAVDQQTHTADGRVATESEQVGGDAASMAYSYDGAGRLTSASLPGEQAEYGYSTSDPGDGCINPDAGENTDRTSVTVTPDGGAATTSRSCFNDADQLVSTTDGAAITTDYAFDAHGNQTDDAGTTLTWDAADRMTSADTATGGTAYSYDPLDRIAKQTSTSATVDYVYGGFTDAPIAATDATGTVTTQFVSLPGGVTLTLTADGGTWSFSDLRGNTMMTTDDTGMATGTADFYDPWGQLIQGTNLDNGTATADFGGFGSSGKLTDMITGIVTLGARAFNPAEARFLSADPVFGGCANAYTYAHGDPLSQQDLTGQKCNSSQGWSWLDTLAAVGIGLAAVGLALTGVGLVVDGVAAATALTVTTTVVSVAGAGLDAYSCANGDELGCVGIPFNAISGLAAGGAYASILATGATRIAGGLGVAALPAALGASGVDSIAGAEALTSRGCK